MRSRPAAVGGFGAGGGLELAGGGGDPAAAAPGGHVPRRSGQLGKAGPGSEPRCQLDQHVHVRRTEGQLSEGSTDGLDDAPGCKLGVGGVLKTLRDPAELERIPADPGSDRRRSQGRVEQAIGSGVGPQLTGGDPGVCLGGREAGHQRQVADRAEGVAWVAHACHGDGGWGGAGYEAVGQRPEEVGRGYLGLPGANECPTGNGRVVVAGLEPARPVQDLVISQRVSQGGQQLPAVAGRRRRYLPGSPGKQVRVPLLGGAQRLAGRFPGDRREADG